jgi:hypothetical protein
MVPQELQQILRLLDFVTDDSPGKPLIDVERFLTCDWVLADNRVLLYAIESLRYFGRGNDADLGLHWLPSHGSSTVARMVSLSNGRVDRAKAL